jgi:hypothetical protein
MQAGRITIIFGECFGGLGLPASGAFFLVYRYLVLYRFDSRNVAGSAAIYEAIS